MVVELTDHLTIKHHHVKCVLGKKWLWPEWSHLKTVISLQETVISSLLICSETPPYLDSQCTTMDFFFLAKFRLRLVKLFMCAHAWFAIVFRSAPSDNKRSFFYDDDWNQIIGVSSLCNDWWFVDLTLGLGPCIHQGSIRHTHTQSGTVRARAHVHACSGVGRLLINGSRSFAPSCLSHRAEGRSCSTLKIISAKLCSVFYLLFFSLTLHLNVCIFTHNLCVCAKAVAAAPRGSERQQGADLSAAGGPGSGGYQRPQR